MFHYLLRRLFLMIPTLFGVTIIVFCIINLAPGSPVEQKLQQMRFSGAGGNEAASAQGKDSVVTNEVIEALNKQYGFDKPLHIRYWIWLKNLSRLDFGESFTYEEKVTDVIFSKFPVSLQFGLVSLFCTYLLCIPLGILKAIKHGSKFDFISSFMLYIAYSIPPFMLAILLIVFFGGGSFYDWFPIAGLVSDNYDELTGTQQIWDRIQHFILPLCCYMVGSFTTLTVLMKNSILDEIKKDYIRTARSKGLSDSQVYFKHALRNALIPIATGLGSFLMVFFAGSLLLETIFTLDGIGLLSFKSVLSRDYNVIMGLIFIQSVLFLVGNLISDITYVLVDPRIDFE